MIQSSGPLRVANWVMLVAFLFSVVVQYNDPDPIRWILLYGFAALNCFLSLRGRLRWPLPGVVGGVALLWALLLAPGVIGKTTIGSLFESFEMANTVVEEAREMGGLLIVAAWMVVLGAIAYASSRRLKAGSS